MLVKNFVRFRLFKLRFELHASSPTCKLFMENVTKIGSPENYWVSYSLFFFSFLSLSLSRRFWLHLFLPIFSFAIFPPPPIFFFFFFLTSLSSDFPPFFDTPGFFFLASLFTPFNFVYHKSEFVSCHFLKPSFISIINHFFFFVLYLFSYSFLYVFFFFVRLFHSRFFGFSSPIYDSSLFLFLWRLLRNYYYDLVVCPL